MILYYKTAARPALKLWLLDDDGSLIDFSDAGWSFVFRVGVVGSAAVLTIPTGQIVGAAGAGVEPTGTPNVTITPAAGNFNIAAKTYDCQMTATIAGLPRVFAGRIQILDVVT